MNLSDSEIRKLLTGTWSCTSRHTPHTITFKTDGSIKIIMTVTNLFNPIQLAGAFVKLFSGDTCEGNYGIRKGRIVLNLEYVPKSWLNLKIAGMRIAGGDILVKFLGAVFTGTKQSELKVESMSSNRMKVVNFWDFADALELIYEKA